MKEDQLEKFVREGASGFDVLEPPAMAWDAIENRLPAKRKSLLIRMRPHLWKAAAAVLIFASAWILSDFAHRPKSPATAGIRMPLNATPELNELSDAEAFYASRISSKQAELAAYTRQHPEILEELKREFSEMDRDREQLNKDLAESHADEKVIEAIILSYRMKIDILDQMLEEMKRAKGESPGPEQTETSL
jgi:hypothetical protein